MTPGATFSRFFSQCSLALLLAASAVASSGQVNVRTLGGGRLAPTGPDSGFVDGDSLQASQFNQPGGLALDATGNLYVADTGNGAVRKLNVLNNRASTLLEGLDRPVALAANSRNELLVLTAGDGVVWKIDRFGTVSPQFEGLQDPGALAIDGSDKLYVTDASGRLFRINPSTGISTMLAEGLNAPAGLAVLGSGLVAVSESGANRIVFIHPDTGQRVTQIGSGTAGFRDGTFARAMFDQPEGIALAPNGSLVIADRGNHRVRLVGTDGGVTTLYGISPDRWEGPECLNCNPVILPGWFDGTAEFSEAREPVAVTVATDGTVYTSEAFYHLVREVTGSDLTAGGTGTDEEFDRPVELPVISPEWGYFPLGHNIRVINPNTNAFFQNGVYYTTDGTDPNTNSLQVTLSEGVGTIPWRETLRDLRSLRLRAFVGGQFSEVTGGRASPVNEIGITRNLTAGPGSTMVVPISVTLRESTLLQSLQFRVEIAPTTPGTPEISKQLRALPISGQDFIPVVTSSRSEGVSRLSALPYSAGLARGLAITFIGTNANFSVSEQAVVSMLAVPIPESARIGDRYTISLLSPSGTSDGAQASVTLQPMPNREIVVASVRYDVGDSSPASWYQADVPSDQEPGFGFGDLRLDNSDVNNAFSAALGVRVPYLFTDLYDALDAYPPDSAGTVGGDGLIRFLDWQLILLRSLQLEPTAWSRSWIAGKRVPTDRPVALANSPASSLNSTTVGPGWIRDAVITSESASYVSTGVATEVPIYVTVHEGLRLAGLAFRATLSPNLDAPAISTPLEFVPSPGLPTPVQSLGLSPDVLLCGWPLAPNHAFDPPIEGKRLLGHIRFVVPVAARPGQSYTLRFANADGSPDLSTQYEFETRSASVWVRVPAPGPESVISDEWKSHFFGNPATVPDEEDADSDGRSNLEEYLAGTDPIRPDSQFRLEVTSGSAADGAVLLQWPTIPGRLYTLEQKTELESSDWTPVLQDFQGNGRMKQTRPPGGPDHSSFYRLLIKLEP